ncbi:EI24 domain-containing protein [Tessaracoccus sp. OH4464_COT-324]|uniref:EI24 domain-containing protein n=1 Tax=Tessaracoccus sp. OH4464_COT-324 TaxID=2491059 RepID=UPI001F3C2868|nr:EI24 domain-containing protein [Tessaracoccus sp. OH4464_COT-324]
MAVLRLTDFRFGFELLRRGIVAWRRRPRLMLIGLVPALLVATAFVVLLAWALPRTYDFAQWVTPFANDWALMWRDALRLTVGFSAALALAVFCLLSFVALTLNVGGPFYQHIWRATEQELGTLPDSERALSTADSLRDTFRLLLSSLQTSVLALLIGLIPLVGVPAAGVFSAVRGTKALALELTAFAGEPRGLSLAQRRLLLAQRPTLAGACAFPVYLAFLVPVLGVLVMPSAVVTGTHLILEVLGETQPTADETSETLLDGKDLESIPKGENPDDA